MTWLVELCPGMLQFCTIERFRSIFFALLVNLFAQIFRSRSSPIKTQYNHWSSVMVVGGETLYYDILDAKTWKKWIFDENRRPPPQFKSDSGQWVTGWKDLTAVSRMVQY